MFESSFLLFFEYLALNVIIPFVPWLLFLWIFYGQKFKWLLLYILSWFVWVWVVAFSLLNIQFLHFWVWKLEYFVIIWICLAAFLLKLFVKKQSIRQYFKTLSLKNPIWDVKSSYKKLSLTEKIFTILVSIFSLYFIGISWVFNFNLPTYWLDSFENWNKPAYNIYTDGWIKLFWNENEILWRWKLGYPIHIPAYKAMISCFAGWINDIYFNTWQRLVFLFWLLFILYITFYETKNIFKSVLPIWLICSLPLVFFHSFEWYMDMASIVYCIISARLFYQYLETEDFDNISLGLLLWFMLSYLKNDWFVVYFPWLLISIFLVLCFSKKLWVTIKWFFKDKETLCKSIWYFIYFFLPFLIIKMVHWLWFNQAAFVESWIWLSDKVHWEIFSQFPQIFLYMDNYNLILIILLFLIIPSFTIKNNKNKNLFLYFWIVTFLILIAIFLFTKNYWRVMNQNTVNRSFSMIFMFLLWFSWFLFHEE